MDLLKLNIQQLDTTGIENTEIASISAINTVQGNLTALSANVVADANTWTNANDFTTYSTVTANIYDTYTTLTANDYSTYTTLSGLIDTVQDNVDSQSSNTQAYISDTLLSNTALIFEAGDGVSLSANSTTGVVTFSTSMSNVTSQTIAIDGSANSFTVTKSIANAHMALVFYNGLAQDPTRYSVDGTTLTLSNVTPLSAGSNLEVRYFDFFSLPGTAEGGGGGGYSFQGSVSGYTSGGGPSSNVIDKFPFSSDTNASDVGDLTQARNRLSGQSSSISGYTSGGPPSVNTIDKFPFSSDANATDVGDTISNANAPAGQSSESHGYATGTGTSPPGSGATIVIEKFPFSSDTNASDVGDLTQARREGAGQSSLSSGYTSGGYGTSNVIDKFPFSSDSNASDVGDLSQGRFSTAGQSSSTHGYTSGGNTDPGYVNTIDKFSFATDGNATDVGDLTGDTLYIPGGQSSTTNGYATGGFIEGSIKDRISKFPFSSDSNATTVGTLTQGRDYTTGQQV